MIKKTGLLVCLAISMPAAGQDWGFSAKLGTLGIGLEAGTSISSNVNVRGVVNLFSYDDTLSESGVDYDVGLDLNSAGLLLDWHPGRSPFRISFGGYYNGNTGDLEARSISGTFNINGTIYNVADVGSLNGEVSYDASAPYIGIGWGSIAGHKRGWHVSWDLGALYQGKPDVGLDVTCSVSLTPAQCTQLTSDVMAESQQLRAEIEDQEWYPVFSVGFLYRF